jgi:hypothetical protein
VQGTLSNVSQAVSHPQVMPFDHLSIHVARSIARSPAAIWSVDPHNMRRYTRKEYTHDCCESDALHVWGAETRLCRRLHSSEGGVPPTLCIFAQPV